MTKKDFKLKDIYRGKNNVKDYSFYTSKEVNIHLADKCGENIFSVPIVTYASKENVVGLIIPGEKESLLVDDEELRALLKELSKEVNNGR